MSRSPRKVLDSKGHVGGGEPTIWPEDLGVVINISAADPASNSVDGVLQSAVDAVLQAIEEAGLSVSVSRRRRTSDGRHATFSCAAARIETIEHIMEGRSSVVGDERLPQDEPVEGSQ